MATPIHPTDRTQATANDPAGVHSIPRRRRILDRVNRLGISLGGQGVIALILAMFVFLVVEAWPLAQGASLGEQRPLELGAVPQAIAMDPYRTHLALLGADGTLRVSRTRDDVLVTELPLVPEGSTATLQRVIQGEDEDLFLVGDDRGRLILTSVAWTISFTNNERRVTPEIRDPEILNLDPAGRPLLAATARRSEDVTSAVAQLANGDLARYRFEIESNEFTGEVREILRRDKLSAPGIAEILLIDPDQRILYASGAAGEISWWRLDEAATQPVETTGRGRARITAMSLLKGGLSLVVGRENGETSLWFRIRYSEFSERLTEARSFEQQDTAIRDIAPSNRDRSFLVSEDDGDLTLFFGTSGRTLWRGPSPLEPIAGLALAPRGDAIVVAGRDRAVELELENPHPEVAWSSYFAPIWYEGYRQPEHVWQSTGGSDEFESKLGLVPLVFGTLKGTVYSLLLAVPLAILGAMYTSQFMHPQLQRVIKPVVEMMASLPSVVLGLVAGLWLAPRLEQHFPALMILLLLAPFVLAAAGWAWGALPPGWRSRFPEGTEVGWIGLALIAFGAVALQTGPVIEAWVFGGDFQGWLFESLDVHYDQRNAAVVGIAMGFAVIPIIFSITEDAFSSVPGELAAGSLALGANRWETVVKVVLPTASPAIFSAVMVGLGRAVGETMIVLMATGNTPIIDWSIFNGFRTLSANIAVEIPEAPQGGTLYRTLFLTALLLFAFTFLINTVAELVRIRLRQWYGRL